MSETFENYEVPTGLPPLPADCEWGFRTATDCMWVEVIKDEGGGYYGGYYNRRVQKQTKIDFANLEVSIADAIQIAVNELYLHYKGQYDAEQIVAKLTSPPESDKLSEPAKSYWQRLKEWL